MTSSRRHSCCVTLGRTWPAVWSDDGAPWRRPLLRGLELRVEAVGKVGLIGHFGAGKWRLPVSGQPTEAPCSSSGHPDNSFATGATGRRRDVSRCEILRTMAPIVPMSDGMIALRPPRPGDAEVLIAGRDEAVLPLAGPGKRQPRTDRLHRSR